MAAFEPWRSREIIWIKKAINQHGQTIYRSRDGKTYNAESIKRTHQKLDEEEPQE
jgi:hypothetical protein